MRNVKEGLKDIPVLGKLGRYFYWWAKLPVKMNRISEYMEIMMRAQANVTSNVYRAETEIHPEMDNMDNMDTMMQPFSLRDALRQYDRQWLEQAIRQRSQYCYIVATNLFGGAPNAL